MRKALVILIVLFGVFLAIGCAGQKAPNETATPVKGVTPVKEVTPVEEVTPVKEVTPVTGVENVTGKNVTNVTGKENVTNVSGQNITIKKKHEQKTPIELGTPTGTQTPARNVTGTTGEGGGVVHVTPGKGK
ncbi:hypothetical protein [Methanosarcina sp. UBA289]|uniref:hypothetical protein n=1 Tax=Methanosarcina sp. UBA289 TaxID=1915574 RepID=UPI0025F9C3AC|nr:hypothetical protein [Methanosarcina sp. UBA289]